MDSPEETGRGKVEWGQDEGIAYRFLATMKSRL